MAKKSSLRKTRVAAAAVQAFDAPVRSINPQWEHGRGATSGKDNTKGAQDGARQPTERELERARDRKREGTERWKKEHPDKQCGLDRGAGARREHSTRPKSVLRNNGRAHAPVTLVDDDAHTVVSAVTPW